MIKIKNFIISGDLDREEGVTFVYQNDRGGEGLGEEIEVYKPEDYKEISKGTKIKVYGNCESGYVAVYIGYFIKGD